MNMDNVFYTGNGIPFKGAIPPDLKNQDPEHLKPVVTYDVSVKKYDLSDDEQFKSYAANLDTIGKLSSQGLASLRFEKFFTYNNKPHVLLSWVSLVKIDRESNINYVKQSC